MFQKVIVIGNQFLAKGRTVYIEGEIRGNAVNGTQYPRIWEGKDGQARASFELTARVVKFLGGRSDNGNGGSCSPYVGMFTWGVNLGVSSKVRHILFEPGAVHRLSFPGIASRRQPSTLSI